MVNDKIVTLGHGAGGETMRRFIRDLFLRHFANPTLNALTDAALVDVDVKRLAFTTDSYVVKPLEFPGGDIGKLSVCGTVNDLAVVGARPLYLSAGFLIEEGFDLVLLERIVHSMAESARAAGVQIVTGDTKVAGRGECDGLFINTSGVGVCPLGRGLSERPIADGDAIILSGTLGDHGVAILGAREHLSFQTETSSDCAALNGLIGGVLEISASVKWMRDPTRGGLAAALSELVEGRGFGAIIDETALPVREQVRAVCELLGFDPLHLANEGKVVAVVEARDAELVLQAMRGHEFGREAELIGRITADGAGAVRVQTEAGGVRRLQRPAGELLPRIC
jgi:hydrogenase expression/formation protein HypE